MPTHLRSREGVALSLAIAKNLVQRLGGTLWAQSGSTVVGHPPADWQPRAEDVLLTLQGGCVVQFTILCNSTASPHLPVAVAMNSPSRPLIPLRVLLAEDNDLNQKITLMMLEKLSCTATVARDGQGALDALEEAEFDLVLMDVNMPVMDGLTATRQIRSLMGKTIPIVAVTASALPEDRDRCLAAGMDRVLFKPLRMEELAAVISHYQPQPSLRLPEPVLPPDAPRLNEHILTELLAVSGGDHTFIAEVIATFLGSTQELIPAMEQAFQERDYATLGRLTHRLKSNSASVGAIALEAICRKLEELIQDLAEDSAAHRQTRQLLGTLTQELRLSAQALDHQYDRLFPPHTRR
ncbi:MAG: response regulator [Oscillatoriales cyanobacterium SM2_2_1]|nr:response regulator [Oscillatoriales cyanobacterium SM2_2_1]